MIELSEAYKEIEIEDKKLSHLNFDCEYCNKSISSNGLNLSVFLYGVAFIVGQKLGYAGITCPGCLNTILLKGDNLALIHRDLSIFRGPNGGHINSDFRYHSSVLYSPNQIENIDSIDISSWDCPVNNNSNEQFNSQLTADYEEYQNLEKNYLCSYILGGETPIGAFASVWWYRPEDIEKLVQIENNHRIRVFPRYVHKMTWYERYDFFCWRYKLYQEYLAGLKDSATDSYNQLREYAYQQDINLDRMIDGNPGITTESIVEYMEEQAQQIAANDIQAASEFLDLLVNFDPAPWDVPGATSDYYKGLWKSITPFKGATVPDSVEELDPEKYNPNMSETKIKEITDKIRPHITKSHIQDWTVENHQGFIEEYISLARRSDFSYGYVWDLKCRYLQQLYGILDKAVIQDAEYMFFSEGPTWTVIFDGKPLRGLKGKGFQYIEYLIKNARQQYHTNHLNEIDAKLKDTSKFLSKDDLKEMKGSDEQIITDDRAKSQYNTRLIELRKTIAEAEENNDIGTSEKASEEYDAILSQLKKDFTRKGKPRTFRDGSNKIKDRIVQAIRRAVKNIKKHNPEIANHFKEALQPINTFQQCYNPEKEIDWQFKD